MVDSKNYEMDNRAYAIKDYGYQPYSKYDLGRRCEIDNIALGNPTIPKANDHFTPHLNHYTPITTYQNSLMGCKIKPISKDRLIN